MIKFFIGKYLQKFSREYDYNIDYMLEVLDVDSSAMTKLSLANGFLFHRAAVPVQMWHAARLRAAKSADCGPCLELAIKLAQEAGMDKQTTIDILRGKAREPDLRLAIDYADAIIANDLAYLEPLEQIKTRFGEAGLSAMSIAILSGQFYPLYKRGLGHATACSPVLQKLGVSA